MSGFAPGHLTAKDTDNLTRIHSVVKGGKVFSPDDLMRSIR